MDRFMQDIKDIVNSPIAMTMIICSVLLFVVMIYTR